MSRQEKLNRADAFSAILSGASAVAASGDIQKVALDEINLRSGQPRKYFDEGGLERLAASIRARGVLQPVLLRRRGDGFELVAGERRYRAAHRAGLEAVPAVVMEISDDEAGEIGLLENLNREDLNPLEETDGILQLLELKLEMSAEDVITVLRSIYDEERGRTGNTGVSSEAKATARDVFSLLGRLTVSSFCAHRLPLLRLPPDLLEALRSGKLEYTKAKLLARIKDEEQRAAVLSKTLEEGLSREDLKMELAELQGRGPDRGGPEPVIDLGGVKRKLTPRRIEKLPEDRQQELRRLLSEIETLFSS